MVKYHSDSERGNMGYSFRLAARVILYAPSHRQDSTYHGLCYISRWALAGTRNCSIEPPWRIEPTTNCTTSERSYHRATSRSLSNIELDAHLVVVSSSCDNLCTARNNTAGTPLVYVTLNRLYYIYKYSPHVFVGAKNILLQKRRNTHTHTHTHTHRHHHHQQQQ